MTREKRVTIPSPEGLDAEIVVRSGDDGPNPAVYADVLSNRIETKAKRICSDLDSY